MEIVPINKTAIISYELVQLLMPLWKVSKKMRRRLIWMLEGKRFLIRYNFSKACNFLMNKLEIPVGLITNSNNLQPISKVARTVVYSQQDMNRAIKRQVLSEVRLCLFEPIKAFNFDFVTKLIINEENCHFYHNMYFSRVYKLTMTNIDSSKAIQAVVDKIYSIDLLTLKGSIKAEIDFSKVKIKKVTVKGAALHKTVKLPKLEKLAIKNCSSFEKLVTEEIPELVFDYQRQFLAYPKLPFEPGIGYRPSKEHILWFESFKETSKLKYLETKVDLDFLIDFMPSCLRKIKHCSKNYAKLSKKLTKNNFPFLFDIGRQFPFWILDQLDLRTITTLTGECSQPLSARPRIINVFMDEIKFYKAHPELFEFAREVVLVGPEFDFDLLPPKLEKFMFACVFASKPEKEVEFDTESRLLSRFKEKCLETGRN